MGREAEARTEPPIKHRRSASRRWRAALAGCGRHTAQAFSEGDVHADLTAALANPFSVSGALPPHAFDTQPDVGPVNWWHLPRRSRSPALRVDRISRKHPVGREIPRSENAATRARPTLTSRVEASMLVAFRHAEAAVIQYVVGCLSQALPKAEVHGGIASEDALMHSSPLEMNGPGSPSRDVFVSPPGLRGLDTERRADPLVPIGPSRTPSHRQHHERWRCPRGSLIAADRIAKGSEPVSTETRHRTADMRNFKAIRSPYPPASHTTPKRRSALAPPR
jgi:hypothetical protein